MNKEVWAVFLVLVTVLGVFVSIQPLLPQNSERFSELGILGPNQKIGNYPTSLVAGQQFSLYGYIGNHEGTVYYYKLLIKLGNQSTIVSNSTFANTPILSSYSHILDDNQSWVFPISMSLNNTGIDLKLIFELWTYNATTSNFEYTGLWAQLYLNVTSS